MATYNVFSQAQEGEISVAAGGGYTIQECSLAAYNAATKDASTLYVITSTGEEEEE